MNNSWPDSCYQLHKKKKWSEHKEKTKVTTDNNNYRAVECEMNIRTAKRLHRNDIHRRKNNQGAVCFKSTRRRHWMSKMLLQIEKGKKYYDLKCVDTLQFFFDILVVVYCQLPVNVRKQLRSHHNRIANIINGPKHSQINCLSGCIAK